MRDALTRATNCLIGPSGPPTVETPGEKTIAVVGGPEGPISEATLTNFGAYLRAHQYQQVSWVIAPLAHTSARMCPECALRIYLDYELLDRPFWASHSRDSRRESNRCCGRAGRPDRRSDINEFWRGSSRASVSASKLGHRIARAHFCSHVSRARAVRRPGLLTARSALPGLPQSRFQARTQSLLWEGRIQPTNC